MSEVIFNAATLGIKDLDELPEGTLLVTRDADWSTLQWKVSDRNGLLARFGTQKNAVAWGRRYPNGNELDQRGHSVDKQDVVALVHELVEEYLVGVGDGSVRMKTGIYICAEARIHAMLQAKKEHIVTAVEARITQIAGDLETKTPGFETPALIDQVLEEIRRT